jgi:hypothetical protein
MKTTQRSFPSLFGGHLIPWGHYMAHRTNLANLDFIILANGE